MISSAIGFFVLLFVQYIMNPDIMFQHAEFYIYSVIAFNLGSNINIFIDSKLDKIYPWMDAPFRRLFFQIILSFLSILIIAVISYYILFDEIHESDSALGSFFLVMVFGFIFILFFNSILVAKNFFITWRKAIEDNEKLKSEKYEANYKALQSKLNPHFLFNSFNVLISEIMHNKENAIKYVGRLSDIYRFVLKSLELNTIELDDELSFLQDYIYLQKVRMGDSLNVSVNIDKNLRQLLIPPMTLQILFENCIKHNAASVNNPLSIDIFSVKSCIIIKNNMQEKISVYSIGTGLDSLNKRYRILSGKELKVENNGMFFSVSIPLLLADGLPEKVLNDQE